MRDVYIDGAAGVFVCGNMDGTKARFELTPEVEFLAVGTLAKEFETSVKAPRFTDRRG